MAEPAPRPDNAQPKDLVTQFREAMADVLIAANRAAEFTQTPAWAELYRHRHAEDRKERRRIAGELVVLAEVLEDRALDPEELKALGATRKDAKDTAAKLQAFVDNVVDDVIKPVRDAEKLADKYRRAAQQEEERHPLHQAGLLELMVAAIKEHQRPVWDQDAGRVSLKD